MVSRLNPSIVRERARARKRERTLGEIVPT